MEGVKVLSDLSCSFPAGSVTVCMGQNGSGKSSFANTLAGHPRYTVTEGSLVLDGVPITQTTADKRAVSGLFLSMQYPYELPGITVNTLLRESFRALHKDVSTEEYKERIKKALALVALDESFLARNVNEGFSGGEKKRCEVLQLLVLQPRCIILDEIDSGLDVDALKCIGKALGSFMEENQDAILVLITHYQKIIDFIKPTQVLVLDKGHLVAVGDASLISSIQECGYGQFIKK